MSKRSAAPVASLAFTYRLQGISKRSNSYLRTLLTHGARSALQYAFDKTDKHSRWLQLIALRGYNAYSLSTVLGRRRSLSFSNVILKLTNVQFIF